MVLVVLLVCFIRKRRSRNVQKNDVGSDTGSPGSSQDIKPTNISALHEIDNNSLYQHRELPDSGKVELLDGNSPSGSGNEISEMPQSPTPVPLCELGSGHTSLATSTLHRQSDRNKNAIFVKTRISRDNHDSSGAQSGSPCVETRISSSPGRKSLDLNRSPELKPSHLNRPLPTPPQRTLDYLNRALPSIPSSNSTDISPTKTNSSTRLSVTRGLHSQSSRTSVTTLSESGSIPPDTALDMIWKDYDMSWESHGQQEPSILSLSSTNIRIMMSPDVVERQMREQASLSSLSTVEIVVPPGTPKSQILSAPSSSNGERSTSGEFF